MSIQSAASNILANNDWSDRLTAPATEQEADMMLGAMTTLAGVIMTGDALAGGLIGVAATCANTASTKDTFRGVGAVACGTLVSGPVVAMLGLAAWIAVGRLTKR